MFPYASPFDHFNDWFADATDTEVQAEAAHLATVDARGQPAGRMVLVRRWSERGFEVQTGVDSPKAAHLRAQPRAALTWYWPSLDRQVRVEGTVEWLTGRGVGPLLAHALTRESAQRAGVAAVRPRRQPR